MIIDWKRIGVWVGAAVLVLLFLWVLWSLFFSGPGGAGSEEEGQFGVGNSRTVVVTTDPNLSSTGDDTNTPQPLVINQSQKIFKISDGPIAGATLLFSGRPTTTVARYVRQDNGRVYDIVIDSPGSIPKITSNTTIPGIAEAKWSTPNVGVLQYQSGSTIKTLALSFPILATTTLATPLNSVSIRFFPDNLSGIAVSPDGTRAAYLFPTEAGVDGYVSAADGTNPKKLFSLPLSQVLLSWPSTNVLLAQTPASVSASGMVYSIDATSGAVSSLLYGTGITATADRSFSHVIYQTTPGGADRATYSHDIRSGTDIALSFDPMPEKCLWGSMASTTMYCAAPLQYVAPDYLDLWHMGAASAPDALFSFNLSTNRTQILAFPGGTDGGVASDIDSFAISPDEKYMVFIKKGERSLWGVRLER